MGKLERERVLALGEERLADLLMECAHSDTVIEQKLKLLTESDSNRLKKVRTQIAGLKRIKQFHDWKAARKLREKIGFVVQAIDALEIEPKKGLELVVAFYETDTAVFGNCDDSSGLISDLYRFDARRLLIKFGSQVDDKEWLADKIFDLNQENGFGVRDYVLAAACQILPESVLRALIQRYCELAKVEGEKTQDEARPWNRPSRRYWMAVQELAAGINDGPLHELATRSVWGDNPLNAAGWNSIAEVYLKAGDPKTALEKLSNIDTESQFQQYETVQLQIAAHKAIGTKRSLTAVKKLLKDRFFQSPSSGTLAEMHELLTSAERSEMVDELCRSFVDGPKLDLGFLEFALQEIDVSLAEAYLLARAEQLDGDRYTSLAAIAKQFNEKNSPLAATLILRALAEAILQRGVSKNYKIAVGYIKRSAKLAPTIVDWKGHPDQATYLKSLRDDHARKTAFWSTMA